NLARGLPPNGMLHRCANVRNDEPGDGRRRDDHPRRGNTCPQILETLGSAELYSEKMSASLCGFTCIADIPLPTNVHRYYSPGATHGGGSGSFQWDSPA